MNRPEVNLASPVVHAVPAPQRLRLGYRPAFDGIRGIAILAVIANHAELVGRPASFVGVDVFFVLSGFLITALLLNEWDAFNRISLKRFYWRRALRLLPALLLMLVVVVAFKWLTVSRKLALDASGDALLALSYVSNWTDAWGISEHRLFAHTWSLSIEEQFYLLWPVILVVLLKRKSSRQSLLRWVILAIVLAIFWRLFIYFGGANEFRISRGTGTRSDSLLMGCVVGVMFASGLLPALPWQKALINVSAFLAVPALVYLALHQGFTNDFNVSFVYGAVSLLTAVIILELVLSQGGVLNRIFSGQWLVYIGKISYGLYLWHYPIFRLIKLKNLSRPKELTIEILLTLIATLLSFYLLERPILRFKKSASR